MAFCFLCGTEMAVRFKTRDHLRPEVLTEYSLAWCAACAFGSIAGRFTPAEVAAFYTADYYTHAADGQLEMASKRWSERLRMHLAWRADHGVDLSPREVACPNTAPTLCDVGCGSGQAMATFQKLGYAVLGIEPDPAARAYAGKIGAVLEGTAESLPDAVSGRQFDAVLLSHSLEHCIHPEAALKNVKRLLAPGGTAIVEVPNHAALGFATYGPAWFFADIPRHLHFFTENSLRIALQRAALQVTRVIYTGYTRQFSAGWLHAQRRIREVTDPDRRSIWDRNAWSLLAKTAFARPARKYDSVRVHAVHLRS